jgi:hypothetical protein
MDSVAANLLGATIAVSTGAFDVLPPGGTADVPLSIDQVEWAMTPPLGIMVVGIENVIHGDDRQAQLIRIPRRRNSETR